MSAIDWDRLSLAEKLELAERRKREGVGQRVRGVVGTSAPAEREVPVVLTRETPAQIRLVFPWSCLVGDNRHLIAVLREGKPMLVQTDQYRRAKAKTQVEARAQLQQAPDAPPLYPTERLALVAMLYTPETRTALDLVAAAKGLHDALEGIVYKNDRQLRDVRWIDAGGCIDAPRAELTLTLVTNPEA